MQFTFRRHNALEGMHATFSPSQSHWLRYDDEKIIEVYNNKKAAEMGTRLHAWAAETIMLGLKQPRSNKTICAYVNDAIGFKMEPEVVLYYSDDFFGTADTISYKNGFLRIHDLKTGKSPVKMEQLLVYAALFCLEYKVKPGELKGCELRIYQNDSVEIFNPTAEDIAPVVDRIIHLNKILRKYEDEEV